MIGYHCADCEAIFTLPTVTTQREFDGDPGGRTSTYESCPECGSFDIEDTSLCERCFDDAALDGYDYCFACLPPDAREDIKRDQEDFTRDQIQPVRALVRS